MFIIKIFKTFKTVLNIVLSASAAVCHCGKGQMYKTVGVKKKSDGVEKPESRAGKGVTAYASIPSV